MGYKEVTDQSGVEKGYIKYQFYIRFKGDQFRKVVTCRKSAVDALFREWEGKILLGVTKQFKFFEILDEYLIHVEQNKSAKALNAESRSILRFKSCFKNILLSDFRRSHVDDFITWRRNKVFALHANTRVKGKVSNATINRDLACLSSFFSYCIRKEYINTINPVALTKLKENNEREVRISREQLEEFLLKAQTIDRQFYNVIVIALLTGMRKKEILTLDWSEVHFDSRFIRLSAHKTKSKKARIVPITPAAMEILSSMKNNSSLVVGEYTDNILRKQWGKLLNMISFRKISDGTDLHFHDLRHIYAQTLLDQGVSLEDIQSLLGHESIQTTQKRYAMFSRHDLQEKAGRMDNVVKIKRVI
ncbi:MAG: hypothetical protein CVV49_00450 [Spirochaetae bacterium HGW-Spirochaetae-5]|nr:MAG: hypothetical protein CVV49_00450 [Spirochaetae bacterium HGW-Spirochaetae-5]